MGACASANSPGVAATSSLPSAGAYAFPPLSIAGANGRYAFVPEWVATRALGSSSLLDPSSFVWRKTLGRGGTSTIQACMHKSVGKVFAVKAIDKHGLYMQKLGPSVRREVIVHSYLDGLDGFATRLFNVTEDESSLLFVMELACGGTLSDLAARSGGRLTEDAARFYICETAVALKLLHDEQYLHGDIKPKNICLDSGGHAKLVDFGSARRVLRRDCGKFAQLSPDGSEWMTTDYAAPELIDRRPYDPSVDWFSLGAVLFELLAGSPPFSDGRGSARRDIELNIRTGARRMLPASTSEACADLLNRLLRQEPSRRLTFEGVASHPWMAGVSWDRVHDRTYRPPFEPELRFRGDLRYFSPPASTARAGRGGRAQSSASGYADAKNFPLCSQVRTPTWKAAPRSSKSLPGMTAGRGRAKALQASGGSYGSLVDHTVRRSGEAAVAVRGSGGPAAKGPVSAAASAAVAAAVSGSLRLSGRARSHAGGLHDAESSTLVVSRPFAGPSDSASAAGGSRRLTTLSGASGLSQPHAPPSPANILHESGKASR